MVLGAIVGCGAVFAVIYFVISPVLSSWKANVSQTKEIHAELDDIREVIRSRPDIIQQIDGVQETIKQLSKHISLPQLGNYLLEMEETIRVCSSIDDMDVEINDIMDNDVLTLPGKENTFKVYRVRVTAIAGLHDLVKFFDHIETSCSYVSVSGLTILPSQEDPEHHHISFIVGWLIWSDLEKRPAFLLEANE